MSATRALQAGKLFRKIKFDVLKDEGSHLPEAYKKFYTEWKIAYPEAVHYRHSTKLAWAKNDKGEVKRIDDMPLPVLYPPESHQGIWGGEGVIKGFQKRKRTRSRVPHFWVPNLKKSAVYSEILDKTMEVTVTERTIDLIIANHGFDNYLLKSLACDLQSGLALKLKRKMLQALYYKTLYPNDALKREEVFNKYKHYLNNYTEEDIEWYGLSIDEALQKYKKDNEKEPVPLKHQFRLQFIKSLLVTPPDQESIDENSSSSPKWFNKLNPFTKEEK